MELAVNAQAYCGKEARQDLCFSQGDYDSEPVKQVLSHMSRFWDRRAQVKLEDPLASIGFDVARADFLAELLPFSEHPRWQSASFEMQSTVLSYAWLLYNWKTIYIETDVITPVCNDVIFKRLPGTNNEPTHTAIAQTLVDEGYHTLMALSACDMVLTARGLADIAVPQFNLVEHMRRYAAEQDANWKQQLVHFATATVSETLISDYLKKIAQSQTIQPLCQLTADAHRRDELAHASVFSQMLKLVYHELSSKQRTFLLQAMPKATTWFADKEFDVWRQVLATIGFPRYDIMLAECAEAGKVNADLIDYSGVVDLLNSIDVDVSTETFLQS